jgi:hypothetical protein
MTVFKKRARSSITGRFVALYYALRHPKLVVLEAIRKRQR